MRKRIGIILAAVLFCLGIAGCAAQQAPRAEGSAQTADAERKTRDAETEETESRAELEVWTFYDRNVPGYYYMFLWDDLAREYGVTLDVRNYPVADMENRLSLALVSGELPDVFFCEGGTSLEPFLQSGVCEATDRYLSGIQLEERFRETYRDGKNYVIPCVVDDYAVVYYDRVMLEKLGLEIPETWEDLESLVKTVREYNKKNKTSYSAISFGGKDGYEGELLLDLLTLQSDREDAAGKILRLNALGAFSPDYMETGDDEAMTNFINHNSVMLVSHSASLQHLIWNMGDGFVPGVFPGGKKKNGTYSMMRLWDGIPPGLCINSASPDKELAGRICISYLKRINEENVKVGGLSILADETAKAGRVHAQRIAMKYLIEHAAKTEAAPGTTLDPDEKKKLRSLTKGLLSGRLSREEFVEDLHES